MQKALALIDQNNFIFCSLTATLLAMVILISLGTYLDMLGAPQRGR